MYSAIQIADFIVAYCINRHSPISNLQLNKILYFVQKDFLKITPEGLFAEDFEAWQFGPVVPSVYYKYCSFGGMDILFQPLSIVTLSRFEKDRVITVVENKITNNPWNLVEETHKPNGAWDKIFQNGKGNHWVIPKTLIRIEE